MLRTYVTVITVLAGILASSFSSGQETANRPAPALQPDLQADLKTVWKTGTDAYKAKNYQLALSSFTELAKRGVDDRSLHLNLALIYSSLGLSENAETEYLTAKNRGVDGKKSDDTSIDRDLLNLYYAAEVQTKDPKEMLVASLRTLDHFDANVTKHSYKGSELNRIKKLRGNIYRDIRFAADRASRDKREEGVDAKDDALYASICTSCPCLPQSGGSSKGFGTWLLDGVESVFKDTKTAGETPKIEDCCDGLTDKDRVLEAARKHFEQLMGRNTELGKLSERELLAQLEKTRTLLGTLEALARGGAFFDYDLETTQLAWLFVGLVKAKGDLNGWLYRLTKDQSYASQMRTESYEPLSAWILNGFKTSEYPQSDGRWIGTRLFDADYPSIVRAVESQIRLDLRAGSSPPESMRDVRDSIGLFSRTVGLSNADQTSRRLRAQLGVRVLRDDFRGETFQQDLVEFQSKRTNRIKSDKSIALIQNERSEEYGAKFAAAALEIHEDIEKFLRENCDDPAQPAGTLAALAAKYSAPNSSSKATNANPAEVVKRASAMSKALTAASDKASGPEVTAQIAEKIAQPVPDRSPDLDSQLKKSGIFEGESAKRSKSDLVQAVLSLAANFMFPQEVPYAAPLGRILLDETLKEPSKLSMETLTVLEDKLKNRSLVTDDLIEARKENGLDIKILTEHEKIKTSRAFTARLISRVNDYDAKTRAKELLERSLSGAIEKLDGVTSEQVLAELARNFKREGWDESQLASPKKAEQYLQKVVSDATGVVSAGVIQELLLALDKASEGDELSGDNNDNRVSDSDEFSALLLAGKKKKPGEEREESEDGRDVGHYLPEATTTYLGFRTGFRVDRYKIEHSGDAPADPRRELPTTLNDLVAVRQSPTTSGVLKLPPTGALIKAFVDGKDVTDQVKLNPKGEYYTLDLVKSRQVDLIAYRNATPRRTEVQKSDQGMREYYVRGHTKIPLKLPDSLRAVIADAKTQMRVQGGEASELKAAAAVRAWIVDNIGYSESEETLALFESAIARAKTDVTVSIQQLILDAKKGDCETVNALFATLMIQEFGIPARLKRGISGRKGHINFANGHTWSQIWIVSKGGWTDFDATPTRRSDADISKDSVEYGKSYVPSGKEIDVHLRCLVRYIAYRVDQTQDDTVFNEVVEPRNPAGFEKWLEGWWPQVCGGSKPNLNLIRGFFYPLGSSALEAVVVWIPMSDNERAITADLFKTVAESISKIGVSKMKFDPVKLYDTLWRARGHLRSEQFRDAVTPMLDLAVEFGRAGKMTFRRFDGFLVGLAPLWSQVKDRATLFCKAFNQFIVSNLDQKILWSEERLRPLVEDWQSWLFGVHSESLGRELKADYTTNLLKLISLSREGGELDEDTLKRWQDGMVQALRGQGTDGAGEDMFSKFDRPGQAELSRRFLATFRGLDENLVSESQQSGASGKMTTRYHHFADKPRLIDFIKMVGAKDGSIPSRDPPDSPHPDDPRWLEVSGWEYREFIRLVHEKLNENDLDAILSDRALMNKNPKFARMVAAELLSRDLPESLKRRAIEVMSSVFSSVSSVSDSLLSFRYKVDDPTAVKIELEMARLEAGLESLTARPNRIPVGSSEESRRWIVIPTESDPENSVSDPQMQNFLNYRYFKTQVSSPRAVQTVIVLGVHYDVAFFVSLLKQTPEQRAKTWKRVLEKWEQGGYPFNGLLAMCKIGGRETVESLVVDTLVKYADRPWDSEFTTSSYDDTIGLYDLTSALKLSECLPQTIAPTAKQKIARALKLGLQHFRENVSRVSRSQRLVLLDLLNETANQLYESKSPLFPVVAQTVLQVFYVDRQLWNEESVAALGVKLGLFPDGGVERDKVVASLAVSSVLLAHGSQDGTLDKKISTVVDGKRVLYAPVDGFETASSSLSSMIETFRDPSDKDASAKAESDLSAVLVNALTALRPLKTFSGRAATVLSETVRSVSRVAREFSPTAKLALVNAISPMAFDKENADAFDGLVVGIVEGAIETLPKNLKSSALDTYAGSGTSKGKKDAFNESVMKLALNPNIFPVLSSSVAAGFERDPQSLRARAIDYLVTQLSGSITERELAGLASEYRASVESAATGSAEERTKAVQRQRKFLRGSFSEYFSNVELGTAVLTRVGRTQERPASPEFWIATAYANGMVTAGFIDKALPSVDKRKMTKADRTKIAEYAQIGFLNESLRRAHGRVVRRGSGETARYQLPTDFAQQDVQEKVGYVMKEQPPIDLNLLSTLNRAAQKLGVRVDAYRSKYRPLDPERNW